ncbi:MAG: FAD:protein FMN transferase [Deltaproteobacteria bacterium]|nr:FAD:protein FMN transferase [Deltaproteobacteria bacterium]
MKESISKITRRQFLQILGGGIGAGLLMKTGLNRWRSIKNPLVVQHAKPLLGTMATITLHHPDFEEGQKAMIDAFAAIEKVDRIMSLHRRDSDLSRINQMAGREIVRVDSSLCDILQTAKEFYGRTEGAYDVTCLPMLKLYGLYANESEKQHYPSDKIIQQTLDVVGSKFIFIDPIKNEAGLTHEGSAIDLGSIGKGYAADRAIDALHKVGIENALIDIGGNMVAIGFPQTEEGSRQGWKVAIRNPVVGTEEPYFETLLLKNESVATSGNYEQMHWLDGRKLGHLFDMRSGQYSNGGTSATVVAKNGTLSDALSTSIFLMGPKGKKHFSDVAKDIYFHGFS